MPRVIFKLGNKLAQGKRYIYCFYRIPGGTRFERSLGTILKVHPSDWDAIRHRVLKTAPMYQEINQLLGKLEVGIEGAAIRAQASGRRIRKEELNDVFNEITGLADKQTAESFTVLAFATRRAQDTDNSRRKNFASHIKKYQEHKKTTLYFEDLDYKFWTDFKKYLTQLNAKDSYSNQLLKTLKTTVREACSSRYKITKVADVLEFKTGITEVHELLQYLTMDEIASLYNARFDNQTFADVRDCFVCACLTGLRISDWNKLDTNKYKTISTMWVDFLEIPTTTKTGAKAIVPLLGYTKEILQRHGGRLPIISDQKTNEYIKEICKLVGFNDEVITTERRAEKVNEIRFVKWEKISAHTGRRTLAALLRNYGMKDEYIEIIGGWKPKKTMVQHYDNSEFLTIAEREEFWKPLNQLNVDLSWKSGAYFKESPQPHTPPSAGGVRIGIAKK